MRCWIVLFSLLAAAPGVARVGMVDVNQPQYPDSSLADFSFLVPAPAGAHGFVTAGADGHFHFADGQRARFWGVNISSASIPQADTEIDAAVERLRRSGVNMLRLEAPDNVGMLLDTADKTSSRALNPDYLRKMQRWMGAAKKNGLYTYLQLLDFRTFKDGDGVPNAAALGRAAKPYAFFDPRLIELQKEYARQILETVNPFTGMKPIDDPAVAVVELANEHGLFIKGDLWRTLAPPYDKQFQIMWNAWLLKRYGSTAALDKAWTSPDGKHALSESESLEAVNVEVPDMSSMDRVNRPKTDWTSVTRSPARVDDGAHFAYDVQRAYFRDMKGFLRGLGVKVPITAVVTSWVAPDTKSVADELDFVAENWYWDHPSFEPKREWMAPFYYNNKDALANTGAWSAAPIMAALKWKGKPVVIREWAAVWPNEYRASSVPLVAAYGAFQDVDAFLAFGYQFNNNGRLADFAFERDPVRWGLMGLGAALFLRADVEPAKDLVELSYDDKALFTWQDYLNSLYRLAYVARVQSVASGDAGKSGAALTLDAQPANPPDALKAALAKLRNDDRKADDDLTLVGVNQGTILGLDSKKGVFSVVAQRSVIVAGRLADLGDAFPGFSTPTKYGALWAESLDGKRLDDSEHYLVKMVSGAKNTGEEFVPSSGQYYPDKFALKDLGAKPITANGKASAVPTRFAFVGATLARSNVLEVGMVNGTWELERDGDVTRFSCDTPGVTVKIPTAASGVAHLLSGQTAALSLLNGAFTYPKDAAYVEVR
ncbi:MAG TPA: hypothetical protein VGM37_06255 [Armatimonadota bacterium]|jgi:hypothetical protein